MSLIDLIVTENQRINAELDKIEDYQAYGPEPEAEKQYKHDDGYRAVVQDHSSMDLIITFENGRIADMEEKPF